MLSISTGPVIALVLLTVIDEPSSFNAILGCTWIHTMKALSSSYHQMLSFLTPQGQIDIKGGPTSSEDLLQGQITER